MPVKVAMPHVEVDFHFTIRTILAVLKLNIVKLHTYEMMYNEAG